MEGRTFAFVRRDFGVQVEKVVKDLKGFELEDRKLQVNPAHFNRGSPPR